MYRPEHALAPDPAATDMMTPPPPPPFNGWVGPAYVRITPVHVLIHRGSCRE